VGLLGRVYYSTRVQANRPRDTEDERLSILDRIINQAGFPTRLVITKVKMKIDRYTSDYWDDSMEETILGLFPF